MKKLHSKGFGAVEVLIIIVVVGLLAAAGWFIWSRQSSKSNDAQATISSSDTQTTQVSSNYIAVPDWGVSLGVGPYTDKVTIAGPYATMDSSNVVVSVNPDDAYYTGCKNSISIARATDISGFDTPPEVKVGEYYYYVSGTSTDDCYTQDGSNVSSNANAISPKMLEDAFNTYGVKAQ